MPRVKGTTSKTTGLDISLQDMVEGIEDELLVVDDKYRVRFANAVIRRRLGEDAGSPIGSRCYEVFQSRDKPCSAPLWECPLRSVLESENGTMVIHHDHTAGVDKYLRVTAYPLKDSSGSVKAILELRRDVTAERELETQILRRHHQLLALSQISTAVSGLWDLDLILNVALDNVLQIINGTIGGILLFDEATQTLSYRVHRGLSAKYVEEVRLSLGQGIAGRVAQSGEATLLEDISREPRTAYPDLISTEGLRGFVSVPLIAKNKVVGVMNLASHTAGHFASDDLYLLNSIGHHLGTAIEQAKLYEHLKRGTERYRALLQHALTAEEEERRRIARELHDETSQSLTGLTLNLQAAIDMVEMANIEPAEIVARLKNAHSLAVQTGTEISRLINNLRPTLLDALGLVPAIRQYAETSLKPLGINLSVESKGIDERLPSEIEVALFRVVQVAISNIAWHSEAKNATVNLERSSNEVILRIEDDGKGFDVSKLTSVDKGGRGAGLFGMKERVSLVGGSCTIESRPGRGTKAMAKIPIIRSEGDAEDKSAGGR